MTLFQQYDIMELEEEMDYSPACLLWLNEGRRPMSRRFEKEAFRILQHGLPPKLIGDPAPTKAPRSDLPLLQLYNMGKQVDRLGYNLRHLIGLGAGRDKISIRFKSIACRALNRPAKELFGPEETEDFPVWLPKKKRGRRQLRVGAGSRESGPGHDAATIGEMHQLEALQLMHLWY
jgi:hypothetical protein